MFWSKVFSTKHDIVVAICDEELIEKDLNAENFRVRISRSFYGGNLIDEENALKLMKRATIGNLIGEKIVELAEKKGFITRENVILIDGVPHAQFVKI